MSMSGEQFSQEPEDFILDEFHSARLSMEKDNTGELISIGNEQEVFLCLKY